jgi:hypothetical protein
MAKHEIVKIEGLAELAKALRELPVELHPNLTRDLHRILTHPI